MVQAMKFDPSSHEPAGRPRKANRAWAGRGSGARCDLCHQIIDEDQVEYEVELPEVPDRTLTLHLGCYERWTLSHEAFDNLEDSW
jgi:hypothetical protein